MSDREGDDGSVVPGEEIFLPGLKRPVIDLVEFCKSFGGELVPTPVDCVIRRDCIVDKLQEGFSEDPAAC